MKHLLVVLFGCLLVFAGGLAGEQPRELSKTELKALLEKASTPQDHLRLAAHYKAKAENYEAESEEHVQMAKMYRARLTGAGTKQSLSPAAHCDSLAESLRKAAKEANELAKAHEEMAKK